MLGERFGMQMAYGSRGSLYFEGDKIVCQVCGSAMKALNSHLVVHGITARDYRDEFGLKLGTALATQSYRQHMREVNSSHLKKYQPAAAARNRGRTTPLHYRKVSLEEKLTHDYSNQTKKLHEAQMNLPSEQRSAIAKKAGLLAAPARKRKFAADADAKFRWKQRLSIAAKRRKPISDETRLKMRNSRLRYVEGLKGEVKAHDKD
jgi:predicted transcriptional regulator